MQQNYIVFSCLCLFTIIKVNITPKGFSESVKDDGIFIE